MRGVVIEAVILHDVMWNDRYKERHVRCKRGRRWRLVKCTGAGHGCAGDGLVCFDLCQVGIPGSGVASAAGLLLCGVACRCVNS